MKKLEFALHRKLNDGNYFRAAQSNQSPFYLSYIGLFEDVLLPNHSYTALGNPMNAW